MIEVRHEVDKNTQLTALKAFRTIRDTMDKLSSMVNPSTAKTIHGLLRAFPDISQQVRTFENKYSAKTESEQLLAK